MYSGVIIIKKKKERVQNKFPYFIRGNQKDEKI